MKPLLAISLLFSSFLGAQEAPPKHLRFIPLGDLPTPKAGKFNKQGKFRTLEELPPGSCPPLSLTLRSGENKLPLQPSLNGFTRLLTIDGKTPKLLLEAKGEAAPWLSSPMPSTPLTLGVLYPDHQQLDWKAPKLLLLRDDAVAFPKGYARFVNVSEEMVLIRIGGPKKTIYGIPPGKTSKKPLSVGANKIWIGYKKGEEPYPEIWTNSLDLNQGERAQFFFYKNQMKNTKKPVLMHWKTETIPKP